MRRTVGWLLLALAPALAQTPDATGTWVKESAPFGPWTIELQQSGSKLTGSLRQAGGLPGPSAIYDGSITGDTLTFKCDSPDGARAITFTGKIAGDEITFERSTRVIRDVLSGNGLFGATAEARFTVRRANQFAPASAAPGAPPKATPTLPRAAPFSYRGFTVDYSSIVGAPSVDQFLIDLRAQIDLIEKASTDAALQTFFRSVPMKTAPTPVRGADNAAYTGATKAVILTTLQFTHEKPIILHELMHAWHDQKAPNGFANSDIRGFFEQARSSGKFPAGSYMLSNPVEYFAMVSSVYLNGWAARDPNTRQELKEKQPDCYAWLEKQFGQR